MSSALAPVAMIGGWTVAAALQPAGFDPVRDTISALAAAPAAHPWVMTAGLALTGACHVVTAAGLRGVPVGGRLLLAVGGVATAAVAALPVTTWSAPHGAAAGVAFVALSVWPAFAWRRGGRGPQRAGVALVASGVLLTALGWFAVELARLTPTDGALTGLSERVVAGAQSLWPLAVVLLVRPRSGARRASPRAPAPRRAPRLTVP